MSQSEETIKTPFQERMSEIRGMVKDCQDREQGQYIFQNLMQQAFILSRRFDFSLKNTSDVRRAHSPRLKESRRKVVRVS